MHQSLPATLTAGSLITIPITLDLTNIESGAYTGNIHFIYANGETFLPIAIRVKDGAIWPLIVLTFAVVIGLTVTQYRSGAFRLDEVGARLDRLDHEIRKQSVREGFDLLKEDRTLQGKVDQARQQLRDHKPDEAEQAIQAAYGLLAAYNQDSSTRYENEKQKLDLLLHGEPKEPYVKSVSDIPDSARQDPSQRIKIERATLAIRDYIAVEESIATARQIAQTQPEAQTLVETMQREQQSLKQIDPLRQPDEARRTIENIATIKQELEQKARRPRGNARPGNAAQARLQRPVATTETATYSAYLTNLLESEVTVPTPDSKASQPTLWSKFRETV
ncbi:MAG: hypothetical protein EOM24_37055, partial [Chloroflexia bacterium]|nr:hypothetical protein [Chloroflexia bacterium]